MESKTYLLLLVIISYISLASCAKIKKNDTLQETTFYVSSDNKSFIGAWIGCQTEGMTLASIRTSSEQALLESTIGAADEGYWLGGVAESASGNWYWTDSSILIAYDNWGTDQPRNYGMEDKDYCMRVGNFFKIEERTKWQAVDCSYKLRYVCKLTQ